MARLGARALIEATVDAGTFTSWDTPMDFSGFAPEYAAELEAARAKSGVDEAVITGAATIDGHPVALIVGEFRFLGGSIGMATAARIVAATERSTTERLPLIAATASGGTRMQEGTPAFIKMVDIAAAIVRHRQAGLPYFVYLRHPTTGGSFASWGSLGHVAVAEPGALIGFLGPVVYETLNGEAFPQGVQTAENLVERGVIDAVVPDEELGSVAARVLRLLSPHGARSVPPPAPVLPPAACSTWESILLTRRADRPSVRSLLRYGADEVLPLNGTGDGEADLGMMLALTAFRGIPCVLIGQDRHYQRSQSMGPAALRAARRGMRIAQELGLPLVSVIDTPGADLSPHAEERALAGEIARCLADMTSMTVPSVSVLLGEGTGGGALATLPAGRVIATEHAWLSPLPPEGASAIVYRDITHAAEMAQRQRVGARQLLEDGIIHAIVPERPAAHEDPVAFAKAVADEIVRQILDQNP